jgi:hypothetical protein
VRERRGAYRILMGKHERRNHLEELGIDGKIILKWIFEKCDGWTNWIEMAQDRNK